MKQRKLINPRKVVRVMNEFVNQVHTPTYTTVTIPAQVKPNETTEEFLERLENAEEEYHPAEFKVVKKCEFCAMLGDDGPVQRIGYNLHDLSTFGSKQFRIAFVDRFPSGKGFADITITLLHEVGHFASEQNFEGYNRKDALKVIDTVPLYFRNFAYFELPDENSATQWAIDWLSNPTNRKIAKAFEQSLGE